MKQHLFVLLAAVALALPAFSAEETRTIRLIQDDAQVKMATKIYNLKHLKAVDIRMYIEAAVYRYYGNSQVRALNFRANKQQSLIVTTAEKFIPYVDQIVATLDRGKKADSFGSKVEGAGYKWQVYCPSYRLAEDLKLPAEVTLSGNGNVYTSGNSTLWLKDDQGDLDYALDWIKYFDRPVPQASLTFRYYSVRESDLRDVGIDYLAWKNGPGMNLVNLAYNAGRISWDKVFNLAGNVASAVSWSYGGVFTAPAFDLSFIRLLQQSGNAKIMATANVTVVNGQDIPAVVVLTPELSAIMKDPSTHASYVAKANNPGFKVKVDAEPVICFFADKKETSDMGWIPATKAFYDKNKGSMTFGYRVITSGDTQEVNNYGEGVVTSANTSSDAKTVHFGREHLLAHVTREFDVEQTTGVPFLCNLPILKYIFGTTTTIKEKNYIFVTVEANLVYPEDIVKKAPAKKVAVKKAPAKKVAAKKAPAKKVAAKKAPAKKK